MHSVKGSRKCQGGTRPIFRIESIEVWRGEAWSVAGKELRVRSEYDIR